MGTDSLYCVDSLYYVYSLYYVLVTVQEGAKRGKLGDAPYKALNIGILGAGSGHLAVLTPILLSGGGGPFLPALLGLWGLGAAVSGSNLLKNGNA